MKRHFVPLTLETFQEATRVWVEHAKLQFLLQHRMLIVQVFGIPSLLFLRFVEFFFNSKSKFLF